MEYKTVSEQIEHTYEIKKSVFICSIKSINSFDEGLEFVKGISKKYSDATHNCYAFIGLNGQQKFSDDGEPQGTAGMPILGVLKKFGLENIACVVTRYFGGIKLGAGGLVQSYTKSVVETLDLANIITLKDSTIFVSTLDYTNGKKLMRVIENLYLPIVNIEYNENMIIKYGVPCDQIEMLNKSLDEQFAGKLEKTIISEHEFLEYKSK